MFLSPKSTAIGLTVTCRYFIAGKELAYGNDSNALYETGRGGAYDPQTANDIDRRNNNAICFAGLHHFMDQFL